MIITAKFASVCPCCSQRIVPGSKIEWSKGSAGQAHGLRTGPRVGHLRRTGAPLLRRPPWHLDGLLLRLRDGVQQAERLLDVPPRRRVSLAGRGRGL